MRRLILCISVALAVSCCSSMLWAYMVTFDDVPIGQDLTYYYQQYGLDMVRGWQVIDSASSGWGTPQSGTQAVIWNGIQEFGTAFGFGVDAVSEYTVRSVGAYFTTESGVVLEMRGYPVNGDPVTVQIGATDQSWTNHYAEISSTSGNIAYVHIVGISAPDARYHFSMDDLTIVVPEPASLLVLCAGLIPLAFRRRRRQFELMG